MGFTERSPPALSRTTSGKQAATFRKQVSDLRQLLRTVFPIAGESILSVRGTGGYRCLFQVSLHRRDGFPIQVNGWNDCRFTELRDGRISISVRTSEVFTALSTSAGFGTEVEAAERQGVHTEDYDLRALGLADQLGNPTGEGRMLLELLRNGGKLTRRGDDKEILRLAKRLREWVGVEAEPFLFSHSRKMWSTVFESVSLPKRGH